MRKRTHRFFFIAFAVLLAISNIGAAGASGPELRPDITPLTLAGDDLLARAKAFFATLWLEHPALAPAPAATVHAELYDVNGEHSASFELPLDGKLSEEDAKAFAQFFKCRRTGRVKRIDPHTIAMLAEIAQRYPGHVIEIVSGYRTSSEEGPKSPHKAGRAIDLRVRGVKTTEVRDWLWSTHREVGIGWYPHSNYLHMDHRGGVHDASWTQPTKNAENRYNPRWAYKARAAQ